MGEIMTIDTNDKIKRDSLSLVVEREYLTEIIRRLEGMSANTDTDPRWRAAEILREYQEPRK